MSEEIIKQALLNEMEGYEFYKLYAEKSSTREAKEAFQLIAEEELKHMEYLKALGRKEQISYDNMDESILSPGIFKKENTIMPEELSLSISAMRIAMKLEADAMEYYRSAKEQSQNEEERELFGRLESWENEHYDWFKNEYEVLKEMWWAENNFEPLY